MAEVLQLVKDFKGALTKNAFATQSLVLTEVQFPDEVIFQDGFHNQKCGRNRCARKATGTALLPHIESVVDLRALLLGIGMPAYTLDPSNKMDDKNPLHIVRGTYARNAVTNGHPSLFVDCPRSFDL
jgi:hypothetical protein